MEASGAESRGLLDQILNCLDDVAALGLKRHDEKTTFNTQVSFSASVFRSVWASFGVFFSGQIKTLQNTSKHLWTVRWTGFGQVRAQKTPEDTSVGVESKRSTPLAFSLLVAREDDKTRRRGQEATLAGRRH
jgi:hypothetical protein